MGKAKIMDKSSEGCIEEQIKLIEDISEIIRVQVSDIDNIGRGVVLSDTIEDLKRAVILNAKRSYLEFFNDIVIFLSNKLREEKEENFRFLLPNIRTLLDIYGRLLYLCSEDENKQTSICMANSLFTLADTVDNSDEGIEESYNKGYKDFKPFFDREDINIPKDIKLFSKGKLEKLELNFPPLLQILKKEIIETSSPETMKIFPRIAKEVYKTYKFISNYIHGNILFKNKHKNQKLWIISKVQILSSLIVDLVNTKVLRDSRKAELMKWAEELSQKRARFVNFWRGRNRNRNA